MKNMKKLLSIVLALAMLFSFAACAKKEEPQKQEESVVDKWPQDTVTITLPVSAGGGNDLFCRVMADYLSKKTGGNFIVVNDTSGGSLAAYEVVRNAKPDGLNFFCYNTSAQVRQYTGMYTHDLETEFEILGPTYAQKDGYVIVTKTGKPYKNWAEFVEYVKAHPGEVTKGCDNRGVPHLQSALIEDKLGLDIVMRETTGGDPDKLAALLGDQFDISVMSANQVTSYVENGDLTVLLFCSLERSEKLPQFDCMADVGLEDVFIETYGFMAAPKGTDPELVKYINELIGGMENEKDCVDAFTNMNYYYKHLSVEDFRAKFHNSAELISNACKLIM